MLIELQEPFKSQWDAGYLVQGTDNRRRVHFVKNGVVVAGMSYARYQMSVQLGYLVPDHLEVDHRDDDKTNDDISNLQVLTKEENRIKQQWHYIQNVQECYGFECAWCLTRFVLTDRQVKMRLAQGVQMAFCCRSCGVSYNHAFR